MDNTTLHAEVIRDLNRLANDGYVPTRHRNTARRAATYLKSLLEDPDEAQARTRAILGGDRGPGAPLPSTNLGEPGSVGSPGRPDRDELLYELQQEGK